MREGMGVVGGGTGIAERSRDFEREESAGEGQCHSNFGFVLSHKFSSKLL